MYWKYASIICFFISIHLFSQNTSPQDTIYLEKIDLISNKVDNDEPIVKETIFIDDKLENINTAKNLKLHTIHLVDPNNIKLEINKFDILQ